MGLLELVCSNRPRPSVHKTGKGHQHWRRDVHHIAEQNLRRTLCNRDASDWLIIGPYVDTTSDNELTMNKDLCTNCWAKLMERRASSGKGD